jgi:disulfide bond formation protein DsbB
MPFVAALIVVLGLAACNSDDNRQLLGNQIATASPSETHDAAQGQRLFVGSCSACHGAHGEGVKGLGKDMQHSALVASLPDDDLAALIRRGRPSSDPRNSTGIDMPPRGGNPTLTDEQLLDIVAYIRSIQQ